MAATFTITITGDQDTLEALSTIQNELSGSLSEPLENSAKMYVNEITENFKTKGQTFEKPWKPLSPATIQIKEDLKKIGKAIEVEQPLVRTGTMREGFLYDIRPKEVSISNTQSYASLHQQGGSVEFRGRKVNVPQRILADIDDTHVEKVAQTFVDWLNSIVDSVSAG